MSAILNRLTIRTKIVGAFGLVLLLVVGLGLTAVNRLAAVNARAKDVRDNWLPSTVAQGNLLSTLKDLRIAEARYVMASSDGEREDARTAVGDREADVDRYRAAYERLISTGTDDARYMSAFDRAWAGHKQVMQSFMYASAADAKNLFSDDNTATIRDGGGRRPDE